MYEVTAAAFFILEYLRKAEIFLKDMENNELMRVHCGGRYKPIVHTSFSLYHSIAIFHYQADCLLNSSACKIHISIRQSDPRLLAKFRRSPS